MPLRFAFARLVDYQQITFTEPLEYFDEPERMRGSQVCSLWKVRSVKLAIDQLVRLILTLMTVIEPVPGCWPWQLE